MADHREADRAPLRLVPVEWHLDPSALEIHTRGITFTQAIGSPTPPPAKDDAGAAAPAPPGENATKQTVASTAMVTAIGAQHGRSWSPAFMDNLLCGERANRFPGDAFATLVSSGG
jgi:hypothetical protein